MKRNRSFIDDARKTLRPIWSPQPNLSGASRCQGGTREGIVGLKVGNKIIKFQLDPCDTPESVAGKLGYSVGKRKWGLKLLGEEKALAFIQKQELAPGEEIIPRVELIDLDNPNWNGED